MKIAILGAGRIGGNLGRLLAQAGHRIIFASRNPGRLDGLLAVTDGDAKAATLDAAVAEADLVIEALPYAAALALDPNALAGKTLVSASNYYPSRDGEVQLGSLGQTEVLADRLPGARVVKAFNMLHYTIFEERLSGGQPDVAMALAGDDPDARRVVSGLIRDAGFVPVNTGPLVIGRSFQTDGPLYAKTMSDTEMRAALAGWQAGGGAGSAGAAVHDGETVPGSSKAPLGSGYGIEA